MPQRQSRKTSGRRPMRRSRKKSPAAVPQVKPVELLDEPVRHKWAAFMTTAPRKQATLFISAMTILVGNVKNLMVFADGNGMYLEESASMFNIHRMYAELGRSTTSSIPCGCLIVTTRMRICSCMRKTTPSTHPA